MPVLILVSSSSCPAARDRLSELTSKDGDWFLDELCTMSGNVSQMIRLLEMCLKYMGLDVQMGSVLFSTINAVNAVHGVYSSMQVCVCVCALVCVGKRVCVVFVALFRKVNYKII